jgi:hypothetical protein
MEIRIPHGLTPAEAARRVREAAQRFDLRVPEGSAEEPDALQGEVEKSTPFGPVRARWRSEAGALVVSVTDRPAFLPADMVQRKLQEGLRELLGS